MGACTLFGNPIEILRTQFQNILKFVYICIFQNYLVDSCIFQALLFLWTDVASANFKTDRSLQEMADSLKALDTKIESKSTFAVTLLVGTSLLWVAFLVSRDTVSLKMVSDETRSNESVYY